MNKGLFFRPLQFKLPPAPSSERSRLYLGWAHPQLPLQLQEGRVRVEERRKETLEKGRKEKGKSYM